MAREKSGINTIILTIIAILLLVGVLGFFLGWFEGIGLSLAPTLDAGVVTQLEATTITLNPECSLSFSPTVIAVGDTITATLRDGANTNCAVYININDGGWMFLDTVTTNSQGVYTASQVVAVAGVAEFAAICASCVTNKVIITVNVPSPDSDGDGFSDDDETDAGTDPNDPNDFPGSEDNIVYTCGQGSDVDECQGTCPSGYLCAVVSFPDADACTCIATNGDGSGTVHPDWKPDGQYYNPQQDGQPPDGGSGSTFCFDNDFHLGFPAKLEVKSSCEDSFGTYFDYCDGSLVHDWFCDGNDCSDALGQNCATYVPGSSCIDGACFTPPTEEEICADRCSPQHSAPLSVTGAGTFDCRDYADNWCVINVPPEGFFSAGTDDLCCCWTCQED